MKFYKIIKDNEFIGVISSGNFVRYNKVSGFLLTSNEIEGEYVQYEGQLYRDSWMSEINTLVDFIQVKIDEITEEEYNIIMELQQDNQEEEINHYVFPDEEEEENIEEPEINEDITVEAVKQMKIAQLSARCKSTIEAGFDLELRGGIHHFSLTTQDQLNLMSLSIAAQTQSLIPYHADGEECTFYSAEEINIIINEATTFKNYHLSYYNSLKAYVDSLDTIEAINAITYGTTIPDEYKTDVLMVLE